MPRIGNWNSGKRSADFKFIDRQMSEWIGASGTDALVHLYLGPHDQTETRPFSLDPFDTNGFAQGAAPNPSPAASSETTIQDVLFLENRDRRYSREVYPMRVIYNVQDSDFDLRQFGLFLTGDTLFLTFHYHDMLSLIGRKLMTGDVIELPHRRDDAPLDPTSLAMNKFYVIEDASWPAEGYSPTWWPHLWRCKVSPMTASQEFQDILDKVVKDPLGLPKPGNPTLRDAMSTEQREQAINDAVVEQAKLNILRRNFETRQYYVVPGDETTKQTPWVYAGDGHPPNGAVLVGAGNRFPQAPAEGDYFLRTDYSPPHLFRKEGSRWKIQEIAYREEWMAAHRLLIDFINESRTRTDTDGTQAPVRTDLSKAVKPKADF